MQSVSCHRIYPVCRQLLKYFGSVSVISTSNRHKLPQEEVDLSGIAVHDAWTFDYRTLLQRGGRQATTSERIKKKRAGKWALRLQSSFPTLYVFGEGNIIYIKNAITLADSLIRDRGITHLFSSFPPYADHIIAMSLKRKYPHLYWIADFRDLHVDPAQDNLWWRDYQMKVNRSILQYADLVTTVSDGLATHLRALHGNVHVLRTGLREIAMEREPPLKKFTICYTGSMFLDKRRPDTMLAAVSELLRAGKIDTAKCEIVYAGKDGAVWEALVNQFGLQSRGNAGFRNAGMLSTVEANRLQRSSHCNVLLTYTTPELKGNLTGKLFDYLSVRRPILVLINGPKDPEIEQMIEDTGCGIVAYNEDQAAVGSFILNLYQDWLRTGDVNAMYNEEVMHKMSWEHMIHQFTSEVNI